MTRIKVSGITNPADAELAATLGVDIVGCVFHASSQRYVTMSQAIAIRRALPTTVALAGIFVDTPTPLVRSVVTHAELDIAQLFGSEPRSAVEALSPRGLKAVTVHTPSELDVALRNYGARRLKPDARPALLVHMVDDLDLAWSAVAEAASRMGIVVASRGLTSANVGDCIAALHPYAVDVWRAVEREPGHLDAERLAEFVAAARDADR